MLYCTIIDTLINPAINIAKKVTFLFLSRSMKSSDRTAWAIFQWLDYVFQFTIQEKVKAKNKGKECLKNSKNHLWYEKEKGKNAISSNCTP